MQQDSSHASFETSLRDQLRAAADVAQSQVLSSGNFSGPPAYPDLAAKGDPDYPSDNIIHDARPAQEHEPPLDGDHDLGEHPHMSGREPAPKRELRKTKRAAQNRAAQRAFRERQSRRMDQLQDRALRFEDLERNFRYLERQNFIMQTYIMTLQNKLSEYTTDIPPIPDEPGPEFAPRPENPEDLNLEGHEQVQGQEGYTASAVEYAEQHPPPGDEQSGEYDIQQMHRSMPPLQQPGEQDVQAHSEPPISATTASMVHELDYVDSRVSMQLPEQQSEQQLAETLSKAV